MGVVLVLLSATCFGAMAVFGKLAYDQGVSPEQLVLIRFALASVLLIALTAVQAARTGRPVVPRRTSGGRTRLVLAALALGGLGYATQATLYFSALDRIDASLVALVLYTYPAFVTLVAVFLGRDRMTPAVGAALVVASAGTLLVLLGADRVAAFDLLGVGLAFGAALAYTAYILVGDSTVRHVPPLTLTMLVMSGATVTLTARALVTGGLDLDVRPAGWLWVACIAVVSTVVASTAFFAGLERIGPSAASILSTFEPVATVALAALVLGELLAPLQVVGGVLVLLSVVLVQLRPRARPAAGAVLAEIEPDTI